MSMLTVGPLSTAGQRIHDVLENLPSHSSKLQYVQNTIRDSQLVNVHLGHLLNWLRCNTHGGSQWPFMLPQLIDVIDKWEHANPDASTDQYGITQTCMPIEWRSFWITNGYMSDTHLRRKCTECGSLYQRAVDVGCGRCYAPWHKSQYVRVGPCGAGTYNLLLQEYTGINVARAAWYSMGRARTIPQLNLA